MSDIVNTETRGQHRACWDTGVKHHFCAVVGWEFGKGPTQCGGSQHVQEVAAPELRLRGSIGGGQEEGAFWAGWAAGAEAQ